MTISRTLSNTVETDRGTIRGIELVGDSGALLHGYYGIPYAEKPIGKFRFVIAQPKDAWGSVLDCTSFRSIPVQCGVHSMEIEMDLENLPESEDCLYLNVTTPATTDDQKLPVMVWLHGGGITNGNGSSAMCNTNRLPEYGMVINVTVNTRLGIFGMMASNLLSNESQNHISGNYIVSDLIAALEWVQKNITTFGGDPDRVTIFGESGGGWKVTALLTSPKAAGLFHTAIIESGTGGVSCVGLKEQELVGDEFLKSIGISTLEELRDLDTKTIINAALKYQPYSFIRHFIIDNYYLTGDFYDVMASGNFNKVPLIVGFNTGEIYNIGFPTKMLPFGVKLATLNTAAGNDTYVYLFGHTPQAWKKLGGDAVHSLELPYVFGDYDNTKYHWPTVWNIEKFFYLKEIKKMPDPGLTEVDKKISEFMMASWSNFAAKCNPNIKNVSWDKWNKDEENYLFIDEYPIMKKDLLRSFDTKCL